MAIFRVSLRFEGMCRCRGCCSGDGMGSLDHLFQDWEARMWTLENGDPLLLLLLQSSLEQLVEA